MKRLLCFLTLAVLLLCCGTLPAMAAQDQVPVGGNTYFDAGEGKFFYYADPAGTIVVWSNVADGMITTQTVTVRSEGRSALQIYLDGQKLEDNTQTVFQTPGEYVVMYVGGVVEQRVLSFTVVSGCTNKVAGYTMPTGFEITGVTLDGQPVAYEKNHVKLSAEGAYDIHYRCRKTAVEYRLSIQTDYTGPTLALAGVTDGVARGPVDISDARNAEKVTIYRDGEKISRTDVLKHSGEYHIELEDAAGNRTSYTFTILIYFDGSSWLFVAIVLLAAAAVMIYLIHAKKHLRVR